MTDFINITCCGCQIQFQMSDALYKKRKRDHEFFYCPNGHAQYFAGKSDLEKLQGEILILERRLEARKDRLDYWRAEYEKEKKRRAAYQGLYKRVKRLSEQNRFRTMTVGQALSKIESARKKGG